jgi:excisionase family DNA binding protein
MRYENPEQARADALCRPMSVAEVMARTGRTKRTIDRWIAAGRIQPVDLGDGRRVLIERDVVELERDMRKAAEENRQRIRNAAGKNTPHRAA